MVAVLRVLFLSFVLISIQTSDSHAQARGPGGGGGRGGGGGSFGGGGGRFGGGPSPGGSFGGGGRFGGGPGGSHPGFGGGQGPGPGGSFGGGRFGGGPGPRPGFGGGSPGGRFGGGPGSHPGFGGGPGPRPGFGGGGFRPTPRIGGGGTIYHGGGAFTVYRGGRPRFTQNNIVIGGTPFIQRSFTGPGGPFVRNYRMGHWGPVYAPGFGFRPAFWGFAYAPWPSPVYYGWGWRHAPWFGFYNYYYQPYPFYMGPGFWLADFILADMLAEYYHERWEGLSQAEIDAHIAQNQAVAHDQAYISDEIKEQIKEEVEAAMKAHEKKETPSMEDLLQNSDQALKHVFVVSDDLQATDENDDSCELTRGDLIRLKDLPQQGEGFASLQVITSKRGNCTGVVLLSVADLQEFLNDFSERLEKGMQKMDKTMVNGQPLQQQYEDTSGAE